MAKDILSPYFFASDVKCGTLNREQGQSGLKKCKKAGLSGAVPIFSVKLAPSTGLAARYLSGTGVGRLYFQSSCQSRYDIADNIIPSQHKTNNFFMLHFVYPAFKG